MTQIEDLEESLEEDGSKAMVRILKVSEVMDAMRVVPRIILFGYMYVVYQIVQWYIDFELQMKTSCDSSTLKVLLDSGMDALQAQGIACSVTEVIGHPNGYTAIVTVMVGAAAVVFGLYSNSGRSWHGDNSMKDQ